MVIIEIDGERRRLDEVEESWITKSINQRTREGQSVCVRVSFEENGITLQLMSAGCPRGNAGGGGSTPPTRRQREVDEMWRKHRLDQAEISSGWMVSFYKDLTRLLS